MNKNLFIYPAVFLFLTGCSIYHIDSESVSSKIHDPKSSIGEVEYVESVSGPHEVVGYVTITAERSQDREKVLEKLRREAMTLGGDAVTDLSIKAPEGWEKIPAQKILGNAYIRAQYKAKVVAYE